ncbi:GNAT family N-acetyltransferase [Nostoc sp. UHCC 0926]|uniref:GNAT family N-acetyltransferase n=1 Tax=Nostoc sp. UHCC 0926 TaxID=3025190 RepID=UPI00308144B3
MIVSLQPYCLTFTLARSHQGKGYATEAVTMLLDYLFIEHNLHRLLANCDRANINSFC